MKPSPYLRHRVSELVKSVHFRLRPPDAVLVVPACVWVHKADWQHEARGTPHTDQRMGEVLNHGQGAVHVQCEYLRMYTDMSGVRNGSCVGKVSHGLSLSYRPAL